MRYTAIFHGCKNDNFQLIVFYYFHILTKNIYCEYTLEPLLMYTPVNPVLLYKSGVHGGIKHMDMLS